MMLWAVGTFGNTGGFVPTKVHDGPVLEVMQPSNDRKTMQWLNLLTAISFFHSLHTLDSGINVGLSLLFFEKF